MKGRKTCSFCNRPQAAATKRCKVCNHPFNSLKVVSLNQTEERVAPMSMYQDNQVVIQNCMPPDYVYLGSHDYQNIEMTGKPVTIHVGMSPKGASFQRNTYGELVSAAWNNCLKRTSLEKKS